jgi:archaellum biogenesis ATPase FlaH
MAEPLFIELSGMPFFNRLLGSGLPAGQLIGLIGPSGGGKTLLALQIAHALALQNKRTLYICLERGNRMPERLGKLVADEPLENTGEEEQMQRQRLFGLRAKNISLLDTPQLDPEPLDALCSDLEGLPDLIVIDQLSLWIMSNALPADDSAIQSYCAYLRAFCERTGCTVLLLHQLKGALKSTPAIRFPETTDADRSNQFGSEYVHTGVFISCQDTQGLCRICVPAMHRHELVWLDGDRGRFRGVGREGLYFGANPRTENFSPTALAAERGLFDPKAVSAYLDSGEQPPGMTLDWDSIFTYYLQDLSRSYARLYTDTRNDEDRRLQYQQPHALNQRRYGPAFWNDVVQQHRTHRLAFANTLAFLEHLTGRGAFPWPDLLRRLPALLRENPGLMERYQEYVADHPPRSPLGAFDHCTTEQEIVACLENRDNEKSFWFFVMTPEQWEDLTDNPENRHITARILDRLLERGRMEELERELGARVKPFFDRISAGLRVQPPGTPTEDPVRPGTPTH